ncbi:MAG: hypothetical protein ACFFBD_28895 [Candidatus Hodarchaeota archaeon]
MEVLQEILTQIHKAGLDLDNWDITFMRRLTSFIDQEFEKVIQKAVTPIIKTEINSKTIKTLVEQLLTTTQSNKDRKTRLQLLRLLIFWYPQSVPVVFACLVEKQRKDPIYQSFEYWLKQIETDLYISRFRDLVKIWTPVDIICPYCASKLLFEHYKKKQRYCVICRQMC